MHLQFKGCSVKVSAVGPFSPGASTSRRQTRAIVSSGSAVYIESFLGGSVGSEFEGLQAAIPEATRQAEIHEA